MKEITEYIPTLDSREVAELIEKSHTNLLRDIKRYVKYLGEINFDFSSFFKECTKKDAPKQGVTGLVSCRVVRTSDKVVERNVEVVGY